MGQTPDRQVDGWTDKQTNRVQHLMRSPSKGHKLNRKTDIDRQTEMTENDSTSDKTNQNVKTQCAFPLPHVFVDLFLL